MVDRRYLFVLAITGFVVAAAFLSRDGGEVVDVKDDKIVKLPEPKLKGNVSVEEALVGRRSVRNYEDEPLTLSELGQMLWSAQGVTVKWGGRTAPSAGATYPLEVYAVVGDVEGLKPGVYHYRPKGHSIEKTLEGDLRAELAKACIGQYMPAKAPVTLVIAAVYERTTKKYGNRGVMYVHMEAGHAGENICLEAESLGLGTVSLGAFNDGEVKKLLKLPAEEEPLYMFPIGHVRG